MFTGLIAELGSVVQLTEDATTCKLTIKAKKVLENLRIGDSIAVNGACLTVVEFSSDRFTADVMPETVRKTNINSFQSGSPVNLERTVRPIDGLDGHIVTGHVEGLGIINSIVSEGNAKVYTISLEPQLAKYVVKKGSIAIDGISLTVVEASENSFSVSLIPHTAAVTTLGFKDVGDVVNLETDILAKYVEKMLFSSNDNQDLKKILTTLKKEESNPELSKETLAENGFF